MSARRYRPEDSIQRAVASTCGRVAVPALSGGTRCTRATRSLSSSGGRPTETQLQFIDDFRAAGDYAVIAEGLDLALRMLRGAAS